jgi:hypothetical protein
MIPASMETIDLYDSRFGIKAVKIPVRWLHECFQLQSMTLLVRLCRAADQSGMAVNYESADLQGCRR